MENVEKCKTLPMSNIFHGHIWLALAKLQIFEHKGG